MPGDHPQPIGFRAYVAMASDHAEQPLHIDARNFGTKDAARRWVEEGRALAPDPANFAASVVAIYGTAIAV
jgi:hypothetical protein